MSIPELHTTCEKDNEEMNNLSHSKMELEILLLSRRIEWTVTI